jgi:molecular chaperone Hsp33
LPDLVADDLIQPFQVETGPVRGRLVRLGATVDTILKRHDYPAPVAVLLGELLLITAAIAGALKFDGIITLQSKSDGPINMMVADLETPGRLRGYARYDADALAASAGTERVDIPVPRLMGAGTLAVTVDQGDDTELYQGFVALEGATLTDCAHAYFRQSEQIEAGLRLAVTRLDEDDAAGGRWRAGGMMVQRLPTAAPDRDAEEAREDAWREALAMMGSLTNAELTDPGLTPDRLLYRLFHEGGVRVFQPIALDEGCRCSAERIRNVLASFRPEERTEMVVDGRILVICEFCNASHGFAPEEFAEPALP